MAKKKAPQQFVIVEPTNEGESEAESPPPDQDELRAIAEMEGGSDIKWTVTRTSDFGNKRAGYVGTLTTGDVSMETIANEWGKGTYRVRGTRSNGQFVKSTTVVIAEEPKRPPQALMPAGSGPTSSVQDFIALMDARAEREGEKWLKWAAILSPLLAPAFSNLFGGAKGTTLTELTTALANIKQLDGGTKVDQMQEFTKLLELVDKVKGDEKPAGSTWADIVRDGIGQVGPILGGLVQLKTGHALPAPAAAATPAIENAKTAEESPMIGLLAWFKSQLEGLIYQASRNRDPLLYAEVVLDNVPAGADLAQLRGILAAEDWWQKLVMFSPGVQPYPQWFAECRAELLKGLDEVLAPPPPAEVTPKPVKAKTPKAAP
jgi:hypothetical protein